MKLAASPSASRRRKTPEASIDVRRIEVAFNEAASDPSRWNSAMQTVADAAHAFGATLLPIRGRLPKIPYSPSMAGAVEAYVSNGWIHRDERYRSVPIMWRRGVATELDFTGSEEINKHPYYQEFLAPHGLRWFAGVRVATDSDFGVCRFSALSSRALFPQLRSRSSRACHARFPVRQRLPRRSALRAPRRP